MSSHLLRLLTTASVLTVGVATAALGQPVPRPTPVAGSVVSTKGGEELQFAREGGWRGVELRQDLIGGDAVRTNAIGTLGILFADQTQIRVGRNSSLVVNEVSSGQNNTQLELQGGQVWARANRGGSGVDVKTPAAVAAIRGTDWSLSVDGNGKTSLVVLEGLVELSNPQGSVTVRRGEGAVAAIGQAPTKFILVSPNDREQMLFYLTLRDAFTWLPATPLKGPALRAERARLQALPAEVRRAEDWLSLAEVAMALDGRKLAAAALAEARARGLAGAQRARADLVDALLTGREGRWAEAAALFARAERGLDGSRRSSASYGRYVAASLADPKRVQPEPKGAANEPIGALARAFVTGFKQDLAAAAAVAREAEKRFPGDPYLPVFSAQMALGLNRPDEVAAAIERARAIDPEDPLVLLTSGAVRSYLKSDINGSLEELYRAAAAAPGRADVWNTIGLVESDRDAVREAEAAFRRAIDADPGDPVAYANLGILLLDQERVDEAGALIDRALEIDPAFHAGLVARGRYELQTNRGARAIESILAGNAANPAYSNGLLAAAVAYFQNGDYDLADQALDNADRLDPNDPVVAIARTAIALDAYQADRAILNARESLKRFRARGGYFAPLAVNRQGGSFTAQAYRFIGLDAWGRFYGDRTFNPFEGASYFDQAAAARPRVFQEKPAVESVEGASADLTSFNLVIQGLLFDPLAVSGRVGRIDILRRPFIDAEVGGSVVSRDGKLGWQSDANVQAFTNSPFPMAASLTVGRSDLNGRTSGDRESADHASAFIGLAPTASDRFLVFGSASTAKPGLATVLTKSQYVFDLEDTTAGQVGAGWSHTFGHRNVVTAAVFASRSLEKRYEDRILDLLPFFLRVSRSQIRTGTEGMVGSLNHTVGFGDFTLRYGADLQRGEIGGSTFGTVVEATELDGGGTERRQIAERTDASFKAARFYGDLMWRPFDWLEAEAGFERTVVDVKRGYDNEAVSPRIGIGVSPVDNHWLRAAYRTDTSLPFAYTLAPITTLGLVPNALPTGLGGETETLALRWDAEWSPRFFTAIDYQRQNVSGLEVPVVDVNETLALDKARIDRASATANLWLGYGIGVFGTVGTMESEIRAGENIGREVPLVAGRFAQAGLTWVHPSRLKVTVSQTFVADRVGNLDGTPLKDFSTTDASITWETPDRRLLMGLSVLNLFDVKYNLAPEILGPSRTLAATLRARF